MRLFTISACLFLTLLVACSKKDVTPVSNNNATPALKADSVAQLPVKGTFTAYTDTFYGMLYESDWTMPTADDSVGHFHVYVFHQTSHEVRFTSDTYTSRVVGGQIDFWNDFIVDSSNYYSWMFENEEDDYTNYQLKKDSIYCNLSQEHCPDVVVAHFAGKRVNKKPVYIR